LYTNYYKHIGMSNYKVHVYVQLYLTLLAVRRTYYVLYARKPDLNTIWVKH